MVGSEAETGVVVHLRPDWPLKSTRMKRVVAEIKILIDS